MAKRIDDPALDVTENDVLVMRNAGPVGAPGMPEAGYIPIPRKLAQKGVKRIAVINPGFVSDCLETLEEIAVAAGETFHHNGGEKFTHIPCLNDSDEGMAHISEMMTTIARARAVVTRLFMARERITRSASCRYGAVCSVLDSAAG